MTEPASNATSNRKALAGANQLLIDLGPILAFVVAYNVFKRIEATANNAVYLATGLFIVATLAAIVWSKLKLGRIPPVLIVTGVLVTLFGGLTIALRDPSLIQIKVTAVNAFYASAIFISFLLRQNIWKLLFGHAFTLPDGIWTVLALRWAGFFTVMAGVNEVLRHFYNEANGNFDVWTNLRPAVFVAVLIFAAANTPLVLKHSLDNDGPDPAQPPAGA